MQAQAPVLYVVSGAGLSAESGLATFRTAGGLWSRYDLDVVCNALTWRRHRDEVFDFYAMRRAEARGAAPNDAHRRLAQWQRRWGAGRVQLITQNVDDLLERAGAEQVLHLHGELCHLHCTGCDTRFEVDDAQFGPRTACPACGSVADVKPGVVFFNEAAPQYRRLDDMRAALRRQDVLLVVGTALAVVGIDQLLPPERFGDALNWQVNPQPELPQWFGCNVAAGAVAGLAELEPRLAQAMAATA